MSSGRRISIRGTVQGVGFRPWVYRVARRYGITGSVRNDAYGVVVEAFGSTASLARFEAALGGSPPPPASVLGVVSESLTGPAPGEFSIVDTTPGEQPELSIPADLATCADCLRELFDPGDRRYRYPFINCTHCGPRYTIVLDLPYDRSVTTMAGFRLCRACRQEYDDPGNRRFHAQPNACPECGPQLSLLDRSGSQLSSRDAALRAAAAAIVDGSIVAVEGLGGFHLVARADDDEAVDRLRRRKRRPSKPFALMAGDLAAAAELVHLDEAAARRLASPQAPIVLLERRAEAPVAPSVAPENRRLGVMLPSTPVHHLLLAAIGRPLVATSGNRGDEPICTDPRDALDRLGDIADLFLVHDRPIARHADDSVEVFIAGEPRPLRRARGWAPQPVRLAREVASILAAGAHMKTVVGLSRGDQVFLSPHIGDMETPQAMSAFEKVIDDLIHMLRSRPVAIVHDLHPDYPTSEWARRAAGGASLCGDLLAGLPTLAVQHHHAHLAACLADNGWSGRILGLTLDGTGYGTDGTVWGGEALLGDCVGFERIARLRPFRLAGGEAAVREPRRCALALLDAVGERRDLPPFAGLEERRERLFRQLLSSPSASPLTSSAGRLFDGIASLVGLAQECSYEGEAASRLELAADASIGAAYPMDLCDGDDGGPLYEIDWRPTVAAVAADVHAGRDRGTIAARFHNALAAALAAVAERVGEARVALTGGCFQNALLTARVRDSIRKAGHEVLLHRNVPPNDGSIALGQIAVVTAELDGASRSGSHGRAREVASCA